MKIRRKKPRNIMMNYGGRECLCTYFSIQALLENKIKYKDIPDVKPLFRLNPPKKGYEGIKRAYVNKGALGYRGKDINKLITRMI